MISFEKVIEKYNIPVPRYTSYPPANLFSEAYGHEHYLRDVQESNERGERALSFYIHIPFCKQICHFCACNKQILPKEESKVEEYIHYVQREFELLKKHLSTDREIVQIHFGGGSPTSIPIRYIREIVEALTTSFHLRADAEVAIEVHPGYVDDEGWRQLVELPFTRYSIGVQDFEEEVLEGANRKPSLIGIEEIVKRIHGAGKRVNLDFIYGLPGQSAGSFEQSISEALEKRPDRLVTFSYAHVPWLHRQQNILERKGLPSVEEKERMYQGASEKIVMAGYKQVGLDHFVLPDDPLAIAQENHLLHRNFQGYCPREISGQVYALGITGISQLHDSYAQNLKSLKPYYEAIDKGELPIHIGYKLSREEALARDIITDLMCNYQVAPLAYAEKYGWHLSTIEELSILKVDALKEMAEDGLLSISERGVIIMNPEAHLFVRNVASTFDRHYNPSSPKGYSKPI